MTDRKTALIVDDERLARKRLRDLLSVHPEICVLGEGDSVEAAASLIEMHRPDIVFLDVEMSPGNGFDLFSMLSAEGIVPNVVFVTAHEAFAPRAFEVSAADYLLKPVSADRLALTIQRLMPAARTELEAEHHDAGVWGMASRLTLNDRKTKRVVEVNCIVAVEAVGAYSQVLLPRLPSMMVLRSISDWERRLPMEEFCRVDRSLIVQTRLLRKMNLKSRDETEIFMEGLLASLTIGRAGTSRLKKHLKEIG